MSPGRPCAFWDTVPQAATSMRQRNVLILFSSCSPLAFFAGYRRRAAGGGRRGPGDRKVLYYVDPMNPSFRSPEPGTAPCGMPLEPVYADGAAGHGRGDASRRGAGPRRPPAAHRRGARDGRAAGTLRHTLRLVGPRAPDETRLFRVTAATAGRIREMGAATTGSLVQQGRDPRRVLHHRAARPAAELHLRMSRPTRTVKKSGHQPLRQLQGGGQLATYERNVRRGPPDAA